MTASPELLALQRAVAGRYTLVRELGRGGMGVVFLAHEHALERPVAIKMLPLDAAHDARRRETFVREARMAAALSHPHVITIHAVDDHDADVVFFAMAFVHGESVGERLRRSGPLPPPELMRVAQEVAWALSHAHASGIVHRDIKPDNVLLESGTDRAIVTDFGIAHRAEVDPRTGEVAGTARYMSPEQAAGLAVDGRSDLYSLGMLVLAAAGLPVDGSADAAALAPRFPRAFVDVIAACLAPDPQQRPSGATEVAARIDAARGATPTVAPPVRHYLGDARALGAEVAGAATGAASAFGLLGLTEVSVQAGLTSGFTQVFAIYACFSVGAAMTGITAVRAAALVQRTRSLVQSGYGHAAVKAAAALDDAASTPPPAAGGWLARSRSAALLAGGTALSAWAWIAGGDALAFIGLAGVNALPALGIRRLVARTTRGRGAFTRLLSGRLGRALFRVAGAGRAPRAMLPGAGEATVHVLADAIDGTVAALAPGVQRELVPVRETLARVRARVERGGAPSPMLVEALEAIRLDLLRLEAGEMPADGVTSAVQAAERLAREVDAQLAGEAEVRRLLAPPTGEVSR